MWKNSNKPPKRTTKRTINKKKGQSFKNGMKRLGMGEVIL